MAALFDTSRENITIHLKNIVLESEVEENSVCKKLLLTAADGKKYNTQFTALMQQFAASVQPFESIKYWQTKAKFPNKKLTKKAEQEYDEFNKTQKIISDFDKTIRELKIKSEHGGNE